LEFLNLELDGLGEAGPWWRLGVQRALEFLNVELNGLAAAGYGAETK
jgi:hypothetical protein